MIAKRFSDKSTEPKAAYNSTVKGRRTFTLVCDLTPLKLPGYNTVIESLYSEFSATTGTTIDEFIANKLKNMKFT